MSERRGEGVGGGAGRGGDSGGEARRSRRLTVAAVREAPGGGHLEVLFLESARIYRLERSHPDFAAVVERLHASRDAGRPLAVAFAADDEARIEHVGTAP